MFELDLIERALEAGIETASEVLAARKRDFAGASEIGNVGACTAWLETVKEARAEFAKLRKAIEDSPHACVNVNADEETGMFWAHVTAAVQDETMNHTSVLLVKCDE